MAKGITVIQDGIRECGSACLLSLVRYYGGNIAMPSLIELTKTNKEGTNFYNLLEAAKEIGLTGKAYKTDDIGKLMAIDKPFICQVIINNYTHFMVIYKFKNKKMTIMDPASGIINMTTDNFLKIWTGNILILEPYKQLPIYEENNEINQVIKEVIYRNTSLIINLLLLTLMIIIFTIIYSYHFKVIVDNIINTNKHNLLVISFVFTIILAFKLITEYIRNNLLLYLNEKIDLSIITTTIDRIISLPYSYYKNKTTGEFIARINDLFYIKNSIAKLITSIILDIILAFIILLILYSINSKMTSYLFIISILYYLIFLLFKNDIRVMTNDIQTKSGNVNSLLVESIGGFNSIKNLNLQANFKKKINKKYLGFINSNLVLTKTLYKNAFFQSICEGLFIIYIIYLGVVAVMDKELSIGSLITYNTLIYYYLNGIKNSFNFMQEFYYVKNSIKRINNLLNFKYEELGQVTNLDMGGDINLNNLNYSYDHKHVVLKNINLKMSKGSKVLILGSSGSGKSTLLKILYKYYHIERGMVTIDNYDLNDFSLADVRSKITFISQNEFLYTDTIRNNIILDRDVSEEEFLKVCKLTYVDDIVCSNILSYNMRIQENGENLSGGERQRIILARALLKKGNIILIDEGLNEIDISLERQILLNIFKNNSDKIIVIVSHRLENIDLFDKVILMSNGTIKKVYVKRE